MTVSKGLRGLGSLMTKVTVTSLVGRQLRVTNITRVLQRESHLSGSIEVNYLVVQLVAEKRSIDLSRVV